LNANEITPENICDKFSFEVKNYYQTLGVSINSGDESKKNQIIPLDA